MPSAVCVIYLKIISSPLSKTNSVHRRLGGSESESEELFTVNTPILSRKKCRIFENICQVEKSRIEKRAIPFRIFQPEKRMTLIFLLIGLYFYIFHRPCKLQYSYTASTSSSSVMEKLTFGSVPGVKYLS